MLDKDRLYLGDNGRCFCGTLRCAGMTSYSSGHDLSGQPVMVIPCGVEADPGRPFRCETCGKEQGRIIRVRG